MVLILLELLDRINLRLQSGSIQVASSVSIRK